MRIVVIGAYGLIGSYVVSALLAQGHGVVGAGRDITMAQRRFPRIHWVRAVLGQTRASDWAAILQGADAVVNCAGALQDSKRDDLQAVHVAGVRDLLGACAASGVRRFIHLSAAGVADGRGSAFNQTKLAAEALVRAAPLDWVILRPGLVLAQAAFGGTALLRGLAAFPGVIPAAYPESPVQLVAATDVAAAVVQCLGADAPCRVSIDLVHPNRLTLAEVLRQLRGWLGLAPARVLRLPGPVVRGASAVCDALAYGGWRSPMRSTSLKQLRAGVLGDGQAAAQILGLRLQSLPQILEGWPAGVQERWFARCYWLKPAVLLGLGGFWFLSGFISLALRLPDSVAVLTVAGMAPGIAKAAVVAGALADMALGVAVGFRRAAAPALLGMVLLTAAYWLGGTILRPDLWLDPLGPFLKTIPAALLALVALAILDER
jgi:uncharacterized protein YbjT (DUF2867 family)